MGWLGRLFKGGQEDEDAPVVERPLDLEVRRAQLSDLDAALTALLEAMDAPPAPIDNPGWRGRRGDLTVTRSSVRTLRDATTFTRDDLFEVLTTIRPVFGRGQAPAGLEHLAALSERVSVATRTLETPLPHEP